MSECHFEALYRDAAVRLDECTKMRDAADEAAERRLNKSIEWMERAEKAEAEVLRLREGIEALAALWQTMAEGGASSAAAREGLADAAALAEYSATMARRARDLRALLDPSDGDR